MDGAAGSRRARRDDVVLAGVQSAAPVGALHYRQSGARRDDVRSRERSDDWWSVVSRRLLLDLGYSYDDEPEMSDADIAEWNQAQEDIGDDIADREERGEQ